jgi:hypothetical protein
MSLLLGLEADLKWLTEYRGATRHPRESGGLGQLVRPRRPGFPLLRE